MSIFNDIFTDPDYDQLNNLVRWNGLNRIKNETVAHHSFIVTWFSRLIVEELLDHNIKFKLEVTTYACFHDFDEMFSGDITHDVKYNSFNGDKIREALDAFGDYSAKRKFNGDTPSQKLLRLNIVGEVNPAVKSIVKLADWLSMAFYVKKEIKLGNKDLFKEYDYCSVKIRECCCNCSKEMKIAYGSNFNAELLKSISNLKFSEYGR